MEKWLLDAGAKDKGWTKQVEEEIISFIIIVHKEFWDVVLVSI